MLFLPRLRLPLRTALACASVMLLPGAFVQPEPIHRLAICFAPGTPTMVQDDMKAAVALYQAADDARWSRTAMDGSFLRRGEPTTLTWSIVADGTPIPGYVGEASAASNLRSWLTIKYGSESQWLPIFEKVFERWSALSGVTYVHESADDSSTLGGSRGVSGVRADIRIGGHRIDGNNGTLAYNFFPDDGDMVIDTSDRYFDTVASDSRRLRNVIAHEHGHGLGMDHVCPVNGTKLMEPTTSSAIDGPQLDDILAAQRLYGDRFEDSETTATAADLGALTPGETIIDDVSIDGTDDVDMFAFSAPPSSRVNVVLVPIGASYVQSEQAANGSCGTGTTYDALRRVDLSVELIGPNGSQRLAFADAAPAGATEELVDIALVSAAPHFVRIVGDNDDVQLYRLVIDVVDPADRPTAVNDAVTTRGAVPARLNVLDNDSGVRDVSLTVGITSKPQNGAATTVGGGIIRYVPARGFVGTDTFTYGIRDAEGRTSTATVTVTVEAARYAGDAGMDVDQDLYPDELETRVASSSSSAASRPASGDPLALSANSARAVQKFRKTSRDALLLRGTLPLDVGTQLFGAEAVVYVGGVFRRFTLDKKGRGKDDKDTIRIGTPGDGGAAFKLTLRNANLSGSWEDEGLLLEDDVIKEYREVTVFVIVGDAAFQTTLPLQFTIRNAKGKSKLVTD